MKHSRQRSHALLAAGGAALAVILIGLAASSPPQEAAPHEAAVDARDPDPPPAAHWDPAPIRVACGGEFSDACADEVPPPRSAVRCDERSRIPGGFAGALRLVDVLVSDLTLMVQRVEALELATPPGQRLPIVGWAYPAADGRFSCTNTGRFIGRVVIGVIGEAEPFFVSRPFRVDEGRVTCPPDLQDVPVATWVRRTTVRAVDEGGRPVPARFSRVIAEGQARPRSGFDPRSWFGPDSDRRQTAVRVASVHSCPRVRVEADGFRDACVTVTPDHDTIVVLRRALRVTVCVRSLAVPAEARPYLTLHSERGGHVALRHRDADGCAPDGAAQVEVVSGGVYEFTVAAPGPYWCSVRWEDPRQAPLPPVSVSLGGHPPRWAEVLVAPLDVADRGDERFAVDLDVTQPWCRAADVPQTCWGNLLGVPLDLDDGGWIPAVNDAPSASLTR